MEDLQPITPVPHTFFSTAQHAAVAEGKDLPQHQVQHLDRQIQDAATHSVLAEHSIADQLEERVSQADDLEVLTVGESEMGKDEERESEDDGRELLEFEGILLLREFGSRVSASRASRVSSNSQTFTFRRMKAQTFLSDAEAAERMKALATMRGS